jgi:hypothetical protein
MIPASYMFKDAYRRAWEYDDLPAPVAEERRHGTGLLTPLAAVLSVLRRPLHIDRASVGRPAYE